MREQEKTKMYIMQAGIERSTSRGMDELCSSSTITSSFNQNYTQHNNNKSSVPTGINKPIVDPSPASRSRSGSGKYSKSPATTKISKIIPMNMIENNSNNSQEELQV